LNLALESGIAWLRGRAVELKQAVTSAGLRNAG
jgi:hypothetical protein